MARQLIVLVRAKAVASLPLIYVCTTIELPLQLVLYFSIDVLHYACGKVDVCCGYLFKPSGALTVRSVCDEPGGGKPLSVKSLLG